MVLRGRFEGGVTAEFVAYKLQPDVRDSDPASLTHCGKVESDPQRPELAGILTRSKFAARLQQKRLSPGEIVASWRALADVVEAAPIEETTLTDPDDAAVLACALAGNADIIVTGDKRLRALNAYRGIRIVTATEALALVASAPTSEREGRV